MLRFKSSIKNSAVGLMVAEMIAEPSPPRRAHDDVVFQEPSPGTVHTIYTR